jgi:hypothetical protein
VEVAWWTSRVRWWYQREYGQVEGDLRSGGQFHAHLDSSGWDGTGRVEAREPPRRLLVTTRGVDEPYVEVIEAKLTADGDQATLVIETGHALGLLAACRAGYQIRAEISPPTSPGREPVGEARWDELSPYQDLAANVG